MTLKVGDKVLLPNFVGMTVKFEGEEFDMYREDEILAKIQQ
jgi:co-chaperonin GroES (HSP10)